MKKNVIITAMLAAIYEPHRGVDASPFAFISLCDDSIAPRSALRVPCFLF